MSNAAPPAFRSVAQHTWSPSARSTTAPISSRSSASSLLTRRDSSTIPIWLITTQWCVRFPESTPTHTVGIYRPFASWSLATTLSIATPARPYPTIGVASLNQRSSYRSGGERPFPVSRPNSGETEPYPPPEGYRQPTTRQADDPSTTYGRRSHHRP